MINLRESSYILEREKGRLKVIIDFSGLKLNDLSPIYLQIVRHVKIKMINREVSDGDEMPSRRVLSAMLEVNPNTIQKAYKAMEEEGFLISLAGSKSLLRFDENLIEKYRRELLESEAGHYIEEVKKMGLDMEQAIRLVEDCWESSK